MLIHANFGAFFGALALSALPETQKNLKSTVKTQIKSHSFRSIFCHSFHLLVTFLLCCECPYYQVSIYQKLPLPLLLLVLCTRCLQRDHSVQILSEVKSLN